jgi:hypothetical protein
MDTQHKVKGKLQKNKQTNKQAKMIRKANYEQKTFDCETRYCHVYRVCVCGSVTNNNTWIRIGYRIYSLWRFITAADYNY